MKYITIIIIALLLITCTKAEFDNPFDNTFEMQPIQGNLLIYEISDNIIILEWQYNEDVKGFYVVEKKVNSGSFIKTAEIEPNSFSPTFTDSLLLTQNIYYYKVYGKNDELVTNAISDSVQTNFIDIVAFTLEEIDIDNVRLSWEHDCNYESGYVLERRKQENLTITKSISSDHETNLIEKGYIVIADLPENTLSYIDTLDTLELDYEYRIKSYSLYNESAVQCLYFFAQFPGPTSLSYVITSISCIELEWNDNSQDEDGFIIDKRIGLNEWQINYDSVSENVEIWTDEFVEINQNLQYRVYAFKGNNISNSVETNQIEHIFSTPTDFNYTIDNNNITLNWAYNLSGIDNFEIARKVNNDEWIENFDEVSPYLFEWTEYGINEFDTYSYKIRAKYGPDYSDYSNEIHYENPVINFEWCTVPSGNFTWGENDEIINIPYDYHIMKYEVTNQEYVDYLTEAYENGEFETVDYQAVEGYYPGDEMFADGIYEYYKFYGDGRINWDGSNFNIEDGFQNHPVVEVTWIGAWAFAEHYGFNLPTEEEWEKAARGNTGNDFPWGNIILGYYANYFDSGDPWDNGTTPVGYYNGQNGTIDGPSPFGVYDLCGNVWEWTNTFGNEYTSERVARGCSWTTFEEYLDLFLRTYMSPTYSYYGFGFRCIYINN